MVGILGFWGKSVGQEAEDWLPWRKLLPIAVFVIFIVIACRSAILVNRSSAASDQRQTIARYRSGIDNILGDYNEEVLSENNYINVFVKQYGVLDAQRTQFLNEENTKYLLPTSDKARALISSLDQQNDILRKDYQASSGTCNNFSNQIAALQPPPELEVYNSAMVTWMTYESSNCLRMSEYVGRIQTHRLDDDNGIVTGKMQQAVACQLAHPDGKISSCIAIISDAKTEADDSIYALEISRLAEKLATLAKQDLSRLNDLQARFLQTNGELDRSYKDSLQSQLGQSALQYQDIAKQIQTLNPPMKYKRFQDLYVKNCLAYGDEDDRLVPLLDDKNVRTSVGTEWYLYNKAQDKRDAELRATTLPKQL